MEKHTRIIRNYSNINFRHTKGKIDIFINKQIHRYYEIYFLLNGGVEFINDHARRKIAPNSVVIIPPGEYHRFIVAEEDADIYERCVLNIYPEFLGGSVLADALYGKELLVLPPDSRIMENVIYLKDSMAKSNQEDFKYILSAVATDIVFLIKQSTNSTQKITREFLNPISIKIMDYINKNYQSVITLQEIADLFSYSVSSVSHIFKNDFGVSIKNFITEKRMNAIHMSLQNGKKPEEISNEFGFSNYSTFYRSYRKHFGFPPSHTSKSNSKSEG